MLIYLAREYVFGNCMCICPRGNVSAYCDSGMTMIMHLLKSYQMSQFALFGHLNI